MGSVSTMLTNSTLQPSGAAQPTDPGRDAGPDTTPDGGVVTLVACPPDHTERTWNFTVSESSFPSWAWR
jgi:hypothetical protein